MSYREDLTIDKFSLDEEWMRQPTLFMGYAEKSAEAKSAYERAKEILDVAKAEVERKVRAEPRQHGLEKVTESAIAATVTLHPRVRAAVDTLIKAREEADIIAAAVRAMDQRKEALGDLVRLFGMSYWSMPDGGNAETRTAIDRMKGRAG